MRPHPRRAETDPTAPRAWATCQRCGFVTNLYKLSWQFEWRGAQLQNTRITVCSDCLDIPQRQLGTIVLPPDPMPVMNARVEPYAVDEVWPMIMEASTPPRTEVPIYLEASTITGEIGTPAISLSLETSTI